MTNSMTNTAPEGWKPGDPMIVHGIETIIPDFGAHHARDEDEPTHTACGRLIMPNCAIIRPVAKGTRISCINCYRAVTGTHA